MVEVLSLSCLALGMFVSPRAYALIYENYDEREI